MLRIQTLKYDEVDSCDGLKCSRFQPPACRCFWREKEASGAELPQLVQPYITGGNTASTPRHENHKIQRQKCVKNVSQTHAANQLLRPAGGAENGELRTHTSLCKESHNPAGRRLCLVLTSDEQLVAVVMNKSTAVGIMTQLSEGRMMIPDVPLNVNRRWILSESTRPGDASD